MSEAGRGGGSKGITMLCIDRALCACCESANLAHFFLWLSTHEEVKAGLSSEAIV